MSPRSLFRTFAVLEATTWALLLVGMFLKYVTQTTELGVSIFGMAHGVVFIAYCLVAVVVWTNQRWPLGVGLLALLSAVPPLATVVFDWFAGRHGRLDGPWRFTDPAVKPASLPELVLAWLTRNPLPAVLAGLVAVAVLTALALLRGG